MDCIDMLQRVALALGPLADEVVFIGGTVPSLLITDPAAPPVRPTKDVDVIVDSRTHSEHAVFEKRLRARGFQIKAPPICRYGIGDILVDVMTTTSHAIGFSDRWYPEAFATAEPADLPNGLTIRVIRAPLFLAAKLDAWHERGHEDYYAEDLEDILAIVDGRATLVDEIRRSSDDVRQFLSREFRKLISDSAFLDAIPGHLGGGAVAHARAEHVLQTLQQIVAMA